MVHPLCGAFSLLYIVADYEGTCEADSRDFSGDLGSWSPCFSMAFGDWELDEVCRFFCSHPS